MERRGTPLYITMEIKMSGIINYYLYIPEGTPDGSTIIDLFYKVNQSVFDKIIKESGYVIMVVPTTVKEACRVEKIDYEKPFPRYASKTHIDFAEEDRRKCLRDQERMETKSKKIEE